MTFTRPTLNELEDQVFQDLRSNLPNGDRLERYDKLAVLSTAYAGMVHGEYGYLQYLVDQLFVQTMDATFIELEADKYGIARIKAVKATGTVTATGTNAVTIPTATTITRGDGQEFTTTADATIAAGSATVSVEAKIAGADGNTSVSTVMTFSNPIAGVDSEVTTISITGGANEETDEELRTRVLGRTQNGPLYGKASDYEQWAKEVSGVTHVFTTEVPGAVIVYFMMYDTYTNGIPLAGDITNVNTVIQSNRPAGIQASTQAPAAKTVNFNINIKPNTVAVQEAIESELKALFRRDATVGGSILISRIREAVSIAAGETDNEMVSPTVNQTTAAGEILVTGSFTWGTIP
jgi:uncharacterized phage protein gp47/JayE